MIPSDKSAFQAHDHLACTQTALASVARICKVKNLRLTASRRRVMEILLEYHKALGAYEILDRLTREGLGSQPPVVYRALDFLVENGFVHKIEKKNAFVACIHPDEGHDPAFMICRECGHVAEAVTPTSALGKAAEALGFQIENTVREAEGLCPDCKRKPDRCR